MKIAKKLLAGVLVFMMSVSPVAFAEEASEDVAPVQEVTENSNYTAAAEKRLYDFALLCFWLF